MSSKVTATRTDGRKVSKTKEHKETAVLHELLDKLQEGDVSKVLHNHPSSESFWSAINASHWPITKKITDKNVAHLVQNLLVTEIISFRKFEIDSFAEGLKNLEFLDATKNNKEVCFKLLCNSIEQTLTPDEFNNLFDARVQRPSDFAQLRSYDWFMDYEEKLICLLQFITGFQSIPPYGLPHNIVQSKENTSELQFSENALSWLY